MRPASQTVIFLAFTMAAGIAAPSPAAAQSEPPICVRAREAQARSSPAAPGLERQCQAAIAASRPPPVPLGRKQQPLGDSSAPPPVPLGRKQQPLGDSAAPAVPLGRVQRRTGDPAERSRPRIPLPDRPESSPPEGPAPETGGIVPSQLTGRTLSRRERLDILAGHNRERARSGAAPLAWDSELEAAAADSVEHMASLGRLVEGSAPAGMGENAQVASPAGHVSVRQMVMTWSRRRQLSSPGTFVPVTEGEAGPGPVSQFTRMVWPATTAIGCALRSSFTADFLVCRYAPGGHVDDVEVR